MLKKFSLPELPYAEKALAPVVSEETLKLHHGKHHKAYVDKLNELLPGSGFEHASLEEIVLHANGPLFNQAGQHWNHSFLWNSMKPAADLTPTGSLLKAIHDQFNSFETLKLEFEKEGAALFGSGWMWLALDKKHDLKIMETKDADSPLRYGMTPLLCLDVWEHAYYLDYKNERPKYLNAFWKIANWEFAQENLARVL